MGEMPRIPTPADLMSEEVVLDRYGHLFAYRELSDARKAGTIAYHNLRKGPHYTNEQLMAYLSAQVRPICQDGNATLDDQKPVPAGAGKPRGSSKLERSGSDRLPAPTPSTVIGMTRALERRAAERLDAEH